MQQRILLRLVGRNDMSSQPLLAKLRHIGNVINLVTDRNIQLPDGNYAGAASCRQHADDTTAVHRAGE